MPFSTATELASEVWARGVRLLAKDDLVRAADCFEHVLEYDQRAADAWLGMYACGERQQEALLAVLDCQDDVGGLRRMTGLSLDASFAIGSFVTFTLSDARQAWLAYVSHLIEDEHYELASQALVEPGVEDDPVKFLRIRCAFDQKDWERVLKVARDIADPFLHDEAQLYVAFSLAHLEMHHEALSALEGVPAAVDTPEFDAEVSFVQGVALEGVGKGEEARQAFQRAYRLAPDVEDFAVRAGAARPEGPRSQPVDRRLSTSPPSEPKEPSGGRGDLLEDAARKLEAMIGLDPVKDQIRTMKAQFRMAALRKERGLPATTRPQHFVFTGPPGTGKTTVARIMGEILAGLGLLEHGEVVETQRGDLVGKHLGSTALKTRNKIDEATGGVLFIDEAYSLVNAGYAGGRDPYGDEAMQEILTAAENRRDHLVIVLAGYTAEIRELLSSNPGLRSRFSTVIDFPSYSAEELLAIAVAILGSGGKRLAADAERALLARFEQVVDAGAIDSFGNARFARELCLKAGARRDLRLIGTHGHSGVPSTEEMTTIEEPDIARAFEELAGGSQHGPAGPRRWIG